MKNKVLEVSSKIVELILVETIEGNGTEDSPCRTVKRYFEKDGNLVFVSDPIKTI